jgi:hypothetical protein
MKRKKTDTVQLSKIRIKEDLRQRLAKDAERKAKTLNSEIVDRLEASYTFKERADEIRALVEEERDRLLAEKEGWQRELEENRKMQEELRQIEGEFKRIEASAAAVNVLLGDDVGAKNAMRAAALLLADNPQLAREVESAIRAIKEKTQ